MAKKISNNNKKHSNLLRIVYKFGCFFIFLKLKTLFSIIGFAFFSLFGELDKLHKYKVIFL